jgi:hypothetical protein
MSESIEDAKQLFDALGITAEHQTGDHYITHDRNRRPFDGDVGGKR